VCRGTLPAVNKAPRNIRIAVIDDDESVRFATECLLREAGYATASFATAEEYLQADDRHRFACVVADIQMPGMSGVALANQLGNNEPRIPVVLITARGENDVLARAASSRALCLLRKPFAAERLLECVHIVVGSPIRQQRGPDGHNHAQ
jgi:FixJ family two-component response regulator